MAQPLPLHRQQFPVAHLLAGRLGKVRRGNAFAGQVSSWRGDLMTCKPSSSLTPFVGAQVSRDTLVAFLHLETHPIGPPNTELKIPGFSFPWRFVSGSHLSVQNQFGARAPCPTPANEVTWKLYSDERLKKEILPWVWQEPGWSVCPRLLGATGPPMREDEDIANSGS